MRQRLESDRAALQELAATVSGIAEKGNTIAADPQSERRHLQRALRRAPAVPQGRVRRPPDRDLRVPRSAATSSSSSPTSSATPSASATWTTPAAIMHAVAGGQPIGALAPHRADLAALRKACRRFSRIRPGPRSAALGFVGQWRARGCAHSSPPPLRSSSRAPSRSASSRPPSSRACRATPPPARPRWSAWTSSARARGSPPAPRSGSGYASASPRAGTPTGAIPAIPASR